MISSQQRPSFRRALLMLVLVFVATVAGATERPVCLDTPMYTREESLQQTLLAARLRYQDWLGQEQEARPMVTLGPWLATRPLSAAEADRLRNSGSR